MPYVLRAVREKRMSKRQEARVDELICRYHGEFYLSFGARISPGFDQYEDGTGTEIELVVEDENAQKAASEFRCCGFVVAVEATR